MIEDIIRSAVILTAVCRGHPVRRGTKCPLHPADNMSALLISYYQVTAKVSAILL